jgi:spermidine synthase
MVDDGIIDRIVTPDGRELVLHHRGGVYTIRVDGLELVSSRGRGSEEALARLACDDLEDLPAPRVLVAGLGMGFTLRAALERLPTDAEVIVVELFAAVAAWNRGVLASPADAPLDDPRVQVMVGDVCDLLGGWRERFHRILLDVDNGPVALTVAANRRLYERDGVESLRSALRPNGALAVWSPEPAPSFARALDHGGFGVRRITVPVSDVVEHTLYVADMLRP